MKLFRAAALASGVSALFMLAFAGCGGHGEEGCSELCERMTACEMPGRTEAECNADCESATDVATKGGCDAAYSEYLECESHANDVCDLVSVEAECKIQHTEYIECMGGGEG